MGEPAQVSTLAGNERVLWYPRPAYGSAHGDRAYAVRIGADGRLVPIKQRLDEEKVAKLTPGASAQDVLRRIGPPGRRYTRAQGAQGLWEYRLEGFQRPRLALVELSPEGVRKVFVAEGRDSQ